MTSSTSWPGKNNPITQISFALMAGFDSQGSPVYTKGTVESAQERRQVQAILEPLRPAPLSIASVTMGELTIVLEDGTTLTLLPVFSPSLDSYRDLFIVDEGQYPLPPSLAELLEHWRKKPE